MVTNLIRGDSLRCSNHEMITVRVIKKGGKISIRDRSQNFRKVIFSFYKELLGRISWKGVSKGRASRKATLFLTKF